MQFKINKNLTGTIIYLFSESKELSAAGYPPADIKEIEAKVKNRQSVIAINDLSQYTFFVYLPKEENPDLLAEKIRKSGANFYKNQLLALNIQDPLIFVLTENGYIAYHFAEGLTLTAYEFLKYKTNKKNTSLKEIWFEKNSISLKLLRRLQTVTDAVSIARDLVNEPPNYLTAVQFSEEIKAIGKKGGFYVKTLDKTKIEQLGMGGLLGVNKGSLLPPTFNILEHKPMNPIKQATIVLVGKGIVYDTGGLSLKPTPNSMDAMKSDMGGGALVTAVIYAAAMMELPIHLVGLIPATDNRPGVDAYAPGDVLKMFSGTTVEVLNTDAEGRLVLADALHYAKKYRPELVLDFATLTGAASRAIGDVGIVFMGNADEKIKDNFRESGYRQYERLVEMPLWEEYGDMLKSDIADLKNIGGAYAGAITAGKFLEHFTDYPWLHFDIAGVTYHTSGKDYRPVGGTGYGVRMVLDYLLHLCRMY